MKGTIKDLIPDPKNANMHTEYGTGLLENSIRQNGFGKSVVISNDGVLIAGNGVAEAAAAIGMERTIEVETDGTELVVVRRKDIKSNTKEFYNMALADNITAMKNIMLNPEVVEAITLEHPEVKVWGTIVAEDKTSRVNKDDAGKTEMKFMFSGWQSITIKKALKIAKGRLGKGEKTNDAALILICKQFIQQSK